VDLQGDIQRSRRELHRGFGDALSRAFEFAATTLVFLGLGWLVDRWLGTTPVFMIVLAVFALVGQFVKLWYAYDAEMRRLERDRELTGFTVAPVRVAVGRRRDREVGR
jgi:uncharacterized membrane protein